MISISQRKYYFSQVLPVLHGAWQKLNSHKIDQKTAHNRIKFTFKFESLTKLNESDFETILKKIKNYAFSEFNLLIH